MATSEVISYFITAVSTTIAIYESYQRYTLKQHLKAESLELYSLASRLLWSTQTCLEAIRNEDNNLITQEAGRSEGSSQALFELSIKNIHRQFNYSRKDIEDWIKVKKIQSLHKDIFLKYAEK